LDLIGPERPFAIVASTDREHGQNTEYYRGKGDVIQCDARAVMDREFVIQ
jgi:hypothetical protein